VTRVTIIGGGTGSFTLLQGLRTYQRLDIRSIVTMMDSGGDSGRLRDEFGVLPPGDIRRCLVALSEESVVLRDLFEFRFDEPPLVGRSFGNLLFLALTRLLGSEQAAIAAASRILKIRGRVIPITWDHVQLIAELEDGTIVEGEASIDRADRDTSIPIVRVYLRPGAAANPEAQSAIWDADVILLAPGDLYTSTIANLLVDGIKQAISKSPAPLVYVLNMMTKHGETDGYTASMHVSRIAHYAGRVPDAVVAHASPNPIPADLVAKYQGEAAYPVILDIEETKKLGVRTLRTVDVMSSTSLIRHDPERTAKVLVDLFSELEHQEALDRESRSHRGGTHP
jgi:uncharacterized cofD-like protein